MTDRYGNPRWGRIALTSVGALIVLAVVLTFVGLVGGWFSGTAETVSFDHSKEQTTVVLDDWESLKTAAQNACDAKSSAHQSTDPVLTEDPALAYKATYRRIAVDYNRRMGNFFEAHNTRGLPIPGGISHLPQQAPSLREMEREEC